MNSNLQLTFPKNQRAWKTQIIKPQAITMELEHLDVYLEFPFYLAANELITEKVRKTFYLIALQYRLQDHSIIFSSTLYHSIKFSLHDLEKIIPLI